jgi:phenylalanyl-tRNA synthetase beta chain
VRVPVGWLRELCPVDLSAEELGELLAWKGAHVESIDRPWEGLAHVIVARVIEVQDHPSSQKLCLARLDTGTGQAEVVVGVRNMSAGDLVPYAPPGARVPVLPGPLDVREIRGVRSSGMLCSPRELHISGDHSGILILDGLEVGADVRRALGLDEVVLDLEIESNRPDLLSIVGIAREVAGATGVPLRLPEVTVPETSEQASTAATVEIKDADGCPRYLARVIRAVGGGRTPLGIQARLTACGMRPISPVVDATNYVMLELGQPLHAFDLDGVAGPGIVVRRSEPGERLTTLDGVERELVDDLLICDLEGPVAIAGVMGAAGSEVGPETRNVLLESAYFEPRTVLRTSRRLQLLTEASVRFSRGTDPEGVGDAATRAARLMVGWGGGAEGVLQGAIDVGTAPPRRRIELRPGRAGAVLGYPVSASEAVEALGRIDIRAEPTDDVVRVEAPSFRPDLQIEEDVIEEIARVRGYDRLPATVPGIRGSGGEQESYRVRRRIRELLVRAGLREAASLTFASQEDVELIGHDRPIRVANPPSAEQPFLRTSLIPGLIGAVRRDLDLGARSVALFEVGHVFRAGEPIDEREHVSFVMAGQVSEGLHREDRAYDVLDVKGVVESLLDGMGAPWALAVPAERPFHPGRSGSVMVGDRPAGAFGEVHPLDASRLDFPGRVAIAELDVAFLGTHGGAAVPVFRQVPRFPPVRRDLAFVLPDEVPAGVVRGAIEAAGGELLDRSLLFDVFRGGAIPEGSKSLAFALEFRAPDRTLTDDEVDPVVVAIVDRLRSELGAELRV